MEPTPTHILLQQMKSPDDRVRDCAFETLVYRLFGFFERYAREKLGNDDASSATDDTFVKIYTSRGAYNETKCTCKRECMCAEARAQKYLWRIHKNTVIDLLRKRRQKKHYESVSLEDISDERLLDPKTPEKYVEEQIVRRAIQRAWKSLSEEDWQLLMHKPGPSRPNLALEQARCEARKRFRTAIAAALAEEE